MTKIKWVMMLALLPARSALHAQEELPTITLAERTVKASITANGVLEAPEQARVAFSVPGEIVELDLEEGHKVELDQVIARLDSEVIDVQMKQVQATVETAQAELARIQAGARPQEVSQAKAGEKKVEAAVAEAESDLKRWEALHAKKSATFKDLEVARTRHSMALQDLENARQRVALLEAGAREEDIEVSRRRLAESRLQLNLLEVRKKKTILKAPIAGVVVRKFMHEGEIADAGTPLLHLVNLARLEAEINVEETFVASIAVGSPGEVLVDALPGQVFPGKVSRIAGMSSEELKLSLLKEEEDVKRFRVTVPLQDPEGRLRAGMSVQGRFTLERKGFFVPEEAVRLKAGTNYVQMVQGTRLIERSVDLGLRQGGQVEISGGVVGGEQLKLWQSPAPGVSLPEGF